MPGSFAISIENLTKIYRLYDSPIDRLKESLHPLRKRYHRDFYALRDVSFNFEKGATVGIIGKNGSGKSTLLKTITGVLTPSSGSVTVNGKISALLELGAGFNPQLTGIENIYLNGAIMGYDRKVMDKKLDDILAFAEIGDFVHQPVKTYSSGMFVRLAFALAVNTDPDILIIDEAMAVGDAKFSKKCYDRFRLFQECGKTILLVTHDTEIIKSFSQYAIYLDGGTIVYSGDPREAVNHYLRALFPVQHKKDFSAKTLAAPPTENVKEDIDQYVLDLSDHRIGQPDDLAAHFHQVRLSGLERPNVFRGGERVGIYLEARWEQEKLEDLMLQHELSSNIIIGLRMQNKKGTNVFSTNTLVRNIAIDPLEREACVVEVSLTMPRLCRDDYFISLSISLGTQERHVGLITNENMVHLSCVPTIEFHSFLDMDHEIFLRD